MWPFKRKKDKKNKETQVAKSEAKIVEKENDSQEAEAKIKPATSERAKPAKTVKSPAKQTVKKSSSQTASTSEKSETEDTKSRKSVYRVIFDKDDKLWKIKKDGAKRIIDSKKTKEEALARVQELSKSQDANFVVYKKDGKFQKKSNLNLKNDSAED